MEKSLEFSGVKDYYDASHPRRIAKIPSYFREIEDVES